MQNLFGDRFLKRFVGEIRRKHNHPANKAEEQKPDTNYERSGPPNDNGRELDARQKDMDHREAELSSTANPSEVNDG